MDIQLRGLPKEVIGARRGVICCLLIREGPRTGASVCCCPEPVPPCTPLRCLPRSCARCRTLSGSGCSSVRLLTTIVSYLHPRGFPDNQALANNAPRLPPARASMLGIYLLGGAGGIC